MKVETWASITVSVRREAIDALSHFFFERGSQGILYDERLLGPDGDPSDPLPPLPASTLLTAYFPEGTDVDAIRKALGEHLRRLDAAFGEGAADFVGVSEVTDDGWSEAWKKHFKPCRAGRRIVVRPSWEPYAADPAEVLLTIDPGQAFGTGTHETTRLCLRLLEDVYDAPGRPPARVLDFGTGTGILGIAAAMLGAAAVLGIDLDPVAAEIAEKNAAVNGVADRFRAAAGPLAAIGERFDLLLGNVVAETLVEARDELLDRVVPGGALILSGILAEKSDWVAREFANAGARLLRTESAGQWSALLLAKGSAGER